jgi:hypothetical protein
MSLLPERNHADRLAVGTTRSSSLLSRDNSTHGTGTAVNTAQYAETGKLKTHSNEKTRNISSLK